MFHSGSQFLAPVVSCDLFILIIIIIIIIIFIIIINFFIRDFSEFTEVVAASLTPLVTNFPEICAFIIGFSFTVWTMRPLLDH